MIKQYNEFTNIDENKIRATKTRLKKESSEILVDRIDFDAEDVAKQLNKAFKKFGVNLVASSAQFDPDLFNLYIGKRKFSNEEVELLWNE